MSDYRVSVAKRDLEIEGCLKKWTNMMTRWKKRYFKLRSGVLYYSKPQTPETPKGFINLHVAKVYPHHKNVRRFVIDSGTKKLNLKAETEAEANKWLEALSIASQLLRMSSDISCEVDQMQAGDPLVFSSALIKRLEFSFAAAIQEVAELDEGEGLEKVLAAALAYQTSLEYVMQLVEDQIHRTSTTFRSLPKHHEENMRVIERADQVEEDIFYDAVDEQKLYVSQASYRAALPAKRDPDQKFNIWKVIKDSIGGDLSKITVPVFFNEPLSFLQRFTEDVAYSETLLKANESDDSCLRLAYVTCFALSTYSFTLDRTLKPFNPLLGETFELETNGLRIISEQVSHHPPISAINCSHDAFEFSGSTELKTSFRGTYLLVRPQGTMHVILKRWHDQFHWQKPDTSVHNLIIGKVYLDHHGTLEVRNFSTGDVSKVHLRKRGWFGKHPNLVEGTVFDSTGSPRFLISGTWSHSLIIKNDQTGEEVTGWEANPMPPNSDMYYHFPEWSMQLNIPPETYGQQIAPTDSRFRPDQRALEEGNPEKANVEKQRLEEKQRAARKLREETGEEFRPSWFKWNGEEWKYAGGYWEAKATGRFPSTADIF